MHARTLSDRLTRRLAAFAGAIIANALFLACLLLRVPTEHYPPAPDRRALTLIGVVKADVARKPPPAPRTQRPHLQAVIAPQHPPSDAPMPFMPPTETVESLPVVPTVESAEVVDLQGLQARCRQAVRSAASAAPPEGTVQLRLFVGPDGRIAQGSVLHGTDNAVADHALLACVETYANVRPYLQGDDPVGSWQQLTWDWSASP